MDIETENNGNNNNKKKNNKKNNLSVDIVIDRLEEIANEDENRYVRGYCLLALDRMNTIPAKNVLIKLLWTSRWCSITTPSSPF